MIHSNYKDNIINNKLNINHIMVRQNIFRYNNTFSNFNIFIR